MKKYLAGLLIIFLICSAAIPDLPKCLKTNAASKTISLVVYKSIDYNSSAYDSTTVQFTIDIQNVEGAEHSAIWTREYKSKLLRAYPVKDSAAIQTITIPQLDNDKQQIEVTYTRIYNSVGYQLKLNNKVALHKSASDTLAICI